MGLSRWDRTDPVSLTMLPIVKIAGKLNSWKFTSEETCVREFWQTFSALLYSKWKGVLPIDLRQPTSYWQDRGVTNISHHHIFTQQGKLFSPHLLITYLAAVTHRCQAKGIIKHIFKSSNSNGFNLWTCFYVAWSWCTASPKFKAAKTQFQHLSPHPSVGWHWQNGIPCRNSRSVHNPKGQDNLTTVFSLSSYSVSAVKNPCFKTTVTGPTSEVWHGA